MNRKKISFWTIFILLVSLLFWYTLVFAWNSLKIEFKSSNNIFLDSIDLNKTQVVLNSKSSEKDIAIIWDCWLTHRLITKKDYLYWYELRFLDKNCSKSKINVEFKVWDNSIKTTFNSNTNYSLYSDFLDYSDNFLKSNINNISKWIASLNSYKQYNPVVHKNLYDYKSKNRRLEELNYMYKFLSNILDKRSNKYIIPLKNWKISTISSKLPNAWRPYRESYTDWIHEWWDFDGNLWDTVYSIDDWIIVRVVDGFYFSDLDKIEKSNNLTSLDKKQNLDILRWKQVWVKTMKWDLAFYSHLDSVFWDISVGDTVMKWQPLGTIWITGVPDKNYNDYHLHIEVRKNPYTLNKAWNYNYDDYMSWDWYFKWKSEEYILENQNNIFE